MNSSTKLSCLIDIKNHKFTSKVKSGLKIMDDFSEDSLEWLMLEHYQFSLINTKFLLAARDITKQLTESGVSKELNRNFEEEKNHAKFYKKALFDIGTDVETRIEFFPTTNFFNKISNIISICPSTTLGAMYATETAAIFEHEVFWNISREVLLRRGIDWEKSRLKAFHNLHLNGVEQAHKDELGVFVDIEEQKGINKELNELQLINTNRVYSGAEQAIHAMDIWWDALLNQANKL